ncbi:early endosome antigen 1 isoform X2 [Hydra vulgaris]|uniref:early endosome antigen 1 isoform X2 n=1 Tax=Hydra vulgaris TaxID=6087 RepID=UPI001F5FA41F|nr:early endosome antigen 1-like isoform X2 [Hydra vulgaris]
MLNRFRGKKAVKGSESSTDSNEIPEKKQGFLCPMCMASFPGPAELQVHFEKVHSGGTLVEEKLLNLDDDNDDDDALPDHSKNDGLVHSFLDTQTDKYDSEEKETSLLRHELFELKSELKEEKWYSRQLKVELETISSQLEKLEEDKKLVEEEYQNQLKSAEIGYLSVVEENKKLKEEIKFADYHTTKERHEKLKLQLLQSQNEVEEEKQRRIVLEEMIRTIRAEHQVKDNDMSSQTNEETISSNYKINCLELERLNDVIKKQISDNQDLIEKQIKGDAEVNSLRHQLSSLEQLKNEIEQKCMSKDTQISSLQTAINTSSEALSIVHEQVNQQRNEIQSLEQKIMLLECSLKEKSEINNSNELAIKTAQEQLTAEKSTIINMEKDLVNYKLSVDELQQKNTDLMDTLKELEPKLLFEKSQVARLEREQVELIAKIETGEGSNAVIQQLSQEKILLSDSISSLEKNLENQTKLHKEQVKEMIHEQTILQERVQNYENEIKKMENLLQDFKDAEKKHLDLISSLNEQLKTKTDVSEQQIIEIKTVKEQLDNLIPNHAQLQQQFKESNELIQKMKAENAQLEQIETELLGKATDMRAELEKIQFEKSSQIKELHDQLLLKDESMSKIIHEKETAIQSLYEEIDKKKQEIIIKAEEINNEKINLEKEIEIRTSLAAELQDWKSKFEKLEHYLEIKDETLNSLQSKLEIAEQDLKKPCLSCKNYEIQLCRLQESLKEENGRLNLLSQQLTALQFEAQEKNLKNEKLNSNIIEVTNQFHEKLSLLEEKISEAAKEKISLSEQLIKTEQKLNEESLFREAMEKSLKEESFLRETSEKALKEESLLREKYEKSFKEESSLREALDKSLKEEALFREALDESLKKESTMRENLEKEVVELKTSLEEKEEKLKEAIVAIKHNEVRLYDLNDSLILKENEITKIWNEKQQLEKDILKKESSLLMVIDEGKVALEKEVKSHKESKEEASQIQLTLKEEIKSWVEKFKQVSEDSQSKIKSLEKIANDLKGDVTVLEARIENCNDEKKALLDRILSTEEKYKKCKQTLNETNKKLEQSVAGLQELGQEYQNLQVRQVMLSNRQWADDSYANSCKKCNKQFNLTTRKHHCRHCGMIFCGTCSQYSAVIASNKNPVRVCETCSIELSDIRGTNVRRISNSSIHSAQSYR